MDVAIVSNNIFPRGDRWLKSKICPPYPHELCGGWSKDIAHLTWSSDSRTVLWFHERKSAHITDFDFWPLNFVTLRLWKMTVLETFWVIVTKSRRSDLVLWQKPLHQQKCQKCRVTTQTTPQKSSIKQQLRTDLGRSVWVRSKIEKVPRGIRGEKSSNDMASSRNLVSTIGALASPKMGDGTRCPEG